MTYHSDDRYNNKYCHFYIIPLNNYHSFYAFVLILFLNKHFLIPVFLEYNREYFAHFFS